jgi:hypothetical protein
MKNEDKKDEKSEDEEEVEVKYQNLINKVLMTIWRFYPLWLQA